MTMTKANFDRIYSPVMRELFFSEFENQQKNQPDFLNLFFNVKNSIYEKEEITDIPGGDLFTEFDGTSKYDEISEGDTMWITHKKFQKGYKMYEDAVDDMVVGGATKLKDKNLDLASCGASTIQSLACEIFTHAFNSTHVGLDGLPLCSASHPYSGSGSGVQNNAGALSLTHDNVVATKALMRAYKDGNGNKMRLVQPDLLIHSDVLTERAEVIAKSMTQSDNNNMNYNVNRGLSNVAVPFFTNDYQWMLVDSRLMKRYMKWYWRKKLAFLSDFDIDDFVVKANARFRAGLGFTFWQFCYGHNASS